MIRSINSAEPKYVNTNKSLAYQNSTYFNPVSFTANMSKTPRPMSKVFSMPLRICEEIIENFSRLRLGEKINRRFGKMSEDGKELSQKINTILGDKSGVRITKKTILETNPTLTPKEISEKYLNDGLTPEVLKNNAKMLKEIAEGKELPISGKPIIV